MPAEIYYHETLPNRWGRDWVSSGNVLYCENFAPGKDQPQPDHFEAVETLVVPFLYRAVMAFRRRYGSVGGPWQFHVMGGASATGREDANQALSLRRAIMLSEYAVQEFEHLWRSQQRGAAPPKLAPIINAVGDKLARLHPDAKVGKKGQALEKAQKAYRCVVFLFSAAKTVSPLNEVMRPRLGRIRTLAGLSVKSDQVGIGEELRAIRKGAKKSTGAPRKGAGQFLDKDALQVVLGALSKRLADSVMRLETIWDAHPAIRIGEHVVNVMVPKHVTYAYQIHDLPAAHGNHGFVYRFDGVEHSDDIDLLELLSFVVKLNGIADYLKRFKAYEILKELGSAKDLVKAIGEFFDVTHLVQHAIVAFVRRTKGDRAAITFARLLDNYETFCKGAFIATSAWSTLSYHRSARGLRAHQLSGRAQRFKAGALYLTHETLEFGGAVENNWIDFNAKAEIGGSFNPFDNHLMQFSSSKGADMRNLGPMLVLE